MASSRVTMRMMKRTRTKSTIEPTLAGDGLNDVFVVYQGSSAKTSSFLCDSGVSKVHVLWPSKGCKTLETSRYYPLYLVSIVFSVIRLGLNVAVASAAILVIRLF